MNCDAPSSAASDVVEQQLRLLEDLADLAVQRARELAQAGLGGPGVPAREPGDAEAAAEFCRYARAVRHAAVLTARIEADLRQGLCPDQQARASGESDGGDGESDRGESRRGKSGRGESGRGESGRGDDTERLEAEELGPAFARRPIAAILGAICADLGVVLDRVRWSYRDPRKPAAGGAEVGTAIADVGEAARGSANEPASGPAGEAASDAASAEGSGPAREAASGPADLKPIDGPADPVATDGPADPVATDGPADRGSLDPPPLAAASEAPPGSAGRVPQQRAGRMLQQFGPPERPGSAGADIDPDPD